MGDEGEDKAVRDRVGHATCKLGIDEIRVRVSA